jgi:capsular polysaccharide biosynthesis protein
VLEQFGMTEFKIVKDWGFVEVERLQFISKGNDVGYLHPINRIVLLEQSELGLRPKSFRNIYLTREDLRRSIKNEREVVQIVQSKGFEIIDPAALSIREQISLFSEAKLVIAPHGGAITNMIYSKEASLLEVMPRERINRCFEWQSLVCSHDYAVHLYSQKEGVDLRKFTSKIENWVSS